MNWTEARELLDQGCRVMREGWCWCALFRDQDGVLRVGYEDRKPTKYRLYKFDERATDWMEAPASLGLFAPPTHEAVKP